METTPATASLVVNEMAIKIHKIALDPLAGQLWFHTESAVGMSDGSTRAGVIVTHFINGRHAVEAPTNDFGVATLETNIPYDFGRASEKNTLTIRVRGSIKSASEEFLLLAGSRAIVTEVEDRLVRIDEYDNYTKEDREVAVKVDIRLSASDFKDYAGVKFRAKLNNHDLGQYITSFDGTCIISKRYPYTLRTDNVTDRVRGKSSVEFKPSDPLIIHFEGVPESFVLRSNA